MLTTAPKEANNSKIKSVKNYSPVVDLRSNANTRETQYDQVFADGFSNGSHLVFDKNTNVYVGDVTTNSVGDIFISFTANNNALVTMDFDISRCADGVIFQACGGFEGNWGYVSFKGNGSYVINANMHANQDYDEPSAFFEMTTSPKDQDQGYNLEISSALTFKAIGNVGSFLRITTGSNNGFFKFNSPYLEVDLDNNGANENTQKYFIYTEYYYDGYANIYVNADEKNPANAYNQSSVLKITGNT